MSELLKFCLNSAMLTLTATGLGIAAVMPGADRQSRRFFMSLFAVLLLCMAVAFTDLIVYENPSMVTEEKIIAYFEYLLISLQMPMFTTYLLHTCAEDRRKSLLLRGVLVLWGIYFILLCVAQGTTFLYYVTPENQFIRGEWHPLLMAPVTFIMLLNLRGVIQRQKNLPPKYYAAFLIYLLPLTVTWIIHTFFFVPEIVFFGIIVSTLSMFGIILHDQIERYMRQQREIAHQRASIMVLQMRPHFIYNAFAKILPPLPVKI